jgi:anti-sigma B factor antagonist
MHINERAIGKVVILDIHGKIIIGAGDIILRKKIDELLARGKTAIILNLASVTYWDSAGLGALVYVFTSLKRAGGNLKLLDLSRSTKNFLDITKLITVFEVYDNEEKAIASFS